jgi:hypothetical protein
MRKRAGRLDAVEVHRRQRTKSGILNEQEVAHIKWQLLQGRSPRSLAEEWDMSLWTMRAIGRGDTWSWVEARQGNVDAEQLFDELDGMAQTQPVVMTPEIAASMAKLKSLTAELPITAMPPPTDDMAARMAIYGAHVPSKPALQAPTSEDAGTGSTDAPARQPLVGDHPGRGDDLALDGLLDQITEESGK